LFLTDAPPYSLKSGKIPTTFYPKMLYLTCVIKINTYTTDSYRQTVKFLKEKSQLPTCQLKDEKLYRGVIRHLHHSTSVDTIKEELNSKGFIIRNITNILKCKLKLPFKTAQDLEQASITFIEMIQSAAKLFSRISNNYSTISNTIPDKFLRHKRKARAK